MAIALSPNGTRAYVANTVSNTISVIDTTSESVVATISLSAFGTHPRAIAVSNDGDSTDSDETIFVTLFWGELRAGKTFLEEGQDDQREGRVVAISAATNAALSAPNPIVLAPMADTGFNSNGKLAPATVGTSTPAIASTNPQTFTTRTGCFPNQLAGIAIRPSAANRGYVVSTCASPNGPLRFNSMLQGVVSAFDTGTRLELTAAQTGSTFIATAPLNMNRGVGASTAPLPRIFYTNPVAIAFRPDGSDAWVAAQQGDVLVRVTFDTDVPTISAPVTSTPGTTDKIVHLDLTAVPSGMIAGKAPRGVAINRRGDRLYSANFISRSVTAVNIATATSPTIVGTTSSSALPAAGTADATAQLGAELFYTGRGPQERMSSEGWGGCITCHPDALSDRVTWMFDTGPRQTIPLDGTFARNNPSDQRILNWSAVRDENQDFELNTRNVFGGRGLIDDDRLFFILGGINGLAESPLVEQLQQFTGAVSTTNDLANGLAMPPLSSARRNFAVATLPDGRIFIFGGRNGGISPTLINDNTTVLEFNPRTNVMRSRSASGFTPRHSLGAAVVRTALGLRIYAYGGYDVGNATATNPVATTEEYNPETNTWRTVASMTTAKAQFGSVTTGGLSSTDNVQRIHVTCGNTGFEGANTNLSSTVERFTPDPTGPGAWADVTGATSLTARRQLGAATFLRGTSQRILVVGGRDAGGILSTVQELIVAPGTGTVTQVGSTITQLNTGGGSPVAAPRADFAISSSLSTNQVYVIGGTDGTSVQTTILELTTNANGAVAGAALVPSGVWKTLTGALSLARTGLGVSIPPPVTNFLPGHNAGRDARQDAIATWMATKVRSSKAAVASNAAGVANGRAVFTANNCASCHGGAKWTRSRVDYPTPSLESDFSLLASIIGTELRSTFSLPAVLKNVGTFVLAGRVNEVRFNGADISQGAAPLGPNGFNIPSLLSVGATAPYFYNGLAQTLDEVFNSSLDGNGGTPVHRITNAGDRADLITFLRSIDESTTIFP